MKWKQCMAWKQELNSDRPNKIKRPRPLWNGKEQGGEDERRWGRHIRRRHWKGGMTKERKPLLWTLPWSSRGRPVHLIRTERNAESEWRQGEEEAMKWGLDDERSTERERGGGWITGAESRSVREACAKCMLLRRMNDGKATAPLSSPLDDFEVDFTCVKSAL